MKKDKTEEYIFLLFLSIPVLWLAIKIAPYIDKGLINVIIHLNDITSQPLSFELTKNTIKSISGFVTQCK